MLKSENNWYNAAGQEIKKVLKYFRTLSGTEWARTTDSRIFSPMLYQLSYSTF